MDFLLWIAALGGALLATRDDQEPAESKPDRAALRRAREEERAWEQLREHLLREQRKNHGRLQQLIRSATDDELFALAVREVQAAEYTVPTLELYVLNDACEQDGMNIFPHLVDRFNDALRRGALAALERATAATEQALQAQFDAAGQEARDFCDRHAQRLAAPAALIGQRAQHIESAMRRVQSSGLPQQLVELELAALEDKRCRVQTEQGAVLGAVQETNQAYHQDLDALQQELLLQLEKLRASIAHQIHHSCPITQQYGYDCAKAIRNRERFYTCFTPPLPKFLSACQEQLRDLHGRAQQRWPLAEPAPLL